ncbi:2-oxoacid:acceptor oxidoreductase family protein [bacterium]|nr:2-oxoacid:acceptor oxidoreductase family protein [bacterium]
MEQSIIIAGFGGQGVLSAGIILANSFMLNDKQVTWYPCYGAEMRGGAVNCEIVVSDTEVTSVHKKETDILIALNDLSFNKFLSKVKSGGIVIANATLIEKKYPREDVKYIFENISDTARELGSIKAANMVSLGILSNICNFTDIKSIKQAIDMVLPQKIRELNYKVLDAGIKLSESCRKE